MKILWKIMKTIFSIIILLIIIIILYKAFARVVLKEQLPTLFGYGGATVISGSMKPNLNVGDYIIVKKANDYYKNDIVIYIDDDNSMVAHRIIEKNNQEFITKGDSNNIADKPIAKNQIKGKVVLVLHQLGMIQIMLSKPVFIIILFLIIIISMIYFRKRDNNDEISNQVY